MKICIINDLKRCGGAEKYVMNLKDILQNDNEVHLLYCTYQNMQHYDNNENIIKPSFGKLSKFIFDYRMYYKIRKYLDSVKPEIVIVNNMVSSPITQYIALHGYKVLQIVHDYGCVCPKSTCLQDNGEICNGVDFSKCIQRCTYHYSKLQLIVKTMQVKVVSYIRRRIVKRFVTPSKMLAKYMRDNGYDNVSALSNPYCIKNFPKISKQKRKENYVYIGGINDNKGIIDLIKGFETFSNDKNVTLDLYGPITDESGKKAIELIQSDKIHYHGKIDNSKVGEIISGSYAMIVPSKWMENYPTTILEGFAYRTLIIGSNRGGIPEMLNNDRGILFQYGIKNLITALETSYNLSENRYFQIINNGFMYVKENNSEEVYRNKIMEIIKDNYCVERK